MNKREFKAWTRQAAKQGNKAAARKELRALAAELRNSSYRGLKECEQALADAVLASKLKGLNVTAVAEAAGLPSTKNLILERAAKAGRLTGRRKALVRAIVLIQIREAGGVAAWNAVHVAAQPMLIEDARSLARNVRKT